MKGVLSKMKLYQLKVNNVLLAISKDKWLIELFIVQRKFKDKKYELIKTNSESTMIYMDIFLMYFMGYAITQDELRYINEITGEHESNIAYQIFSLQCIMNDNIKWIIGIKRYTFSNKCVLIIYNIYLIF